MKKTKREMFVIKVNGMLVPVTEELYKEYWEMSRRERYLEERDCDKGTFSYNAKDTPEMLGVDIIPNPNVECPEKFTINKLMTDMLYKAFDVLSKEERKFIDIMYYSDTGSTLSQREVAKKLGISQPQSKNVMIR